MNDVVSVAATACSHTSSSCLNTASYFTSTSIMPQHSSRNTVAAAGSSYIQNRWGRNLLCGPWRFRAPQQPPNPMDLECILPRDPDLTSKTYNLGALIIRIGFGGKLYYNLIRNPQDSRGPILLLAKRLKGKSWEAFP